ncbi:hypothetical protein ACEWF5_09700, partial [Bifidobacterium longum subsp. longum]|uniref:hypothetical protein n=1 Tax=Bifidobacterium longum TaxID=216816 RepID=UPI003CFD9692
KIILKSKANTQSKKNHRANDNKQYRVYSDNRSNKNGNKTTNLTSNYFMMGKVMIHYIGSCFFI